MPKGVRGRSSDNTLVKKVLKWQYEITLKKGLGLTYDWIYNQLKNNFQELNIFLWLILL
jgi:nucleoside-diphosphate-sugar epimerase